MCHVGRLTAAPGVLGWRWDGHPERLGPAGHSLTLSKSRTLQVGTDLTIQTRLRKDLVPGRLPTSLGGKGLGLCRLWTYFRKTKSRMS